jgi:hypothetical protein
MEQGPETFVKVYPLAELNPPEAVNESVEPYTTVELLVTVTVV